MKPLFHAFLSFMILLTGCATTRQLTEITLLEDATIILRNGEVISADYAISRTDSLSCQQIISSNRLCIPGNKVKRIYIFDHGKGALYGLLYGSLTGAVLSAIIIGSTNQTSGHLKGLDTALSIIGTLILAGTGLLVGALIGHKYEYKISRSPDEYIMLELSPEELEAAILLIKPTTMKIEITSIVVENNQELTILWKDKEITLSKTDIKDIIGSDDGIYIVIPYEIFINKFKSE